MAMGMTLGDFVHQNPWWVLAYIVVFCITWRSMYER
jgi:hypothetical protein